MIDQRPLSLVLWLPLAACGSSASTGDIDAPVGQQADAANTLPDAPAHANAIKHVFMILRENHSWSSIKGSASAAHQATRKHKPMRPRGQPLSTRANSPSRPPVHQ